MTNRPLRNTSFALLGLLSFGEMSGYDLKRLADRSIRYFYWSPASSQIYAELRRFAELGYVTEREVEQARRPDKRIYRITEAGLAALREWLSEGDSGPVVVKNPLLLRIFFGTHAPVESLMKEIEQERRRSLGVLESLRESERECRGHPGSLFTYLTIAQGLAVLRARLDWADEALRLLETHDPEFTWHGAPDAGRLAPGEDRQDGQR